jgi:dATP pyrophosphohydrolase
LTTPPKTLPWHSCSDTRVRNLTVARAPFQVLVFPYRALPDGDFEFAVFRRSDDGRWQAIAGGGEDDETPLQAAQREAWEEAGIPAEVLFLPLDSVASVPVTFFPESVRWGEQVYVVPEYAFGVEATQARLVIADEHSEFRWLTFSQAKRLLTYGSNRVALWELNQKIRGLGPRDPSAETDEPTH